MADILDEMTKDEIITWVRQQMYYTRHLPRKSELLWMRYQKEDAKAASKRDASIKRGKDLDMSKRDEYARQFNSTKDNDERLSLLHKMEPYDKAMMAYIDESREIMKAEEKVDKLYEQYENERKKEAIAEDVK